MHALACSKNASASRASKGSVRWRCVLPQLHACSAVYVEQCGLAERASLLEEVAVDDPSAVMEGTPLSAFVDERTIPRVMEGRGRSWKVMEGHERSWKVMEGRGRSWKVMEGHGRS